MLDEMINKSVRKVEQGILTTFPSGLSAMVRGIQMLEYLYDQEKKDYSYSRYSEKLNPKGSNFDPGLFEELKVRFLTRITAYLVTVYALEGIFIKSYKHFLEILGEIGYAVLVSSYNAHKLLDERKDEISDYLFYRHKVFAHTSFAMPRRDSKSLQHTSIEYFAGNLLFLKDSYLALGGGSLIIDGVEEELPEVSIVSGHQAVRNHYSKWEDMFTEALGRIPDGELSNRLSGIKLL